MREASRTQTTQGNEKASRSGYAGIYVPFQGYHSVTFVVMSVVIMGGRGMIFFFPTATQWQACPVLMAAVAFAARRIGFFFLTGIKEENGTGDCGWENGFWLLATERTQTSTTNCDESARTSNHNRKRPHVFKHAAFKLRCAKCELKYTPKSNSTQKYTECPFAPENQ